MPPPVTSELSAAIEGLYQAFASYPLPEHMPGCPCCHSVDADRPLHSRPLRKLTEEDLDDYARSALLTWGDLDQFRHFLPRIFELAVIGDELSFVDRPIVFEKLSYAEWRYWPEAEQKAVKDFLMAVWRAVIEDPPEEIVPRKRYYPCNTAEEWLCALAHAGDLSPYLDEWLRASSAAAMWNLATIITRTGMLLAQPQGMSAFWNGHMDQAEQVSIWLRSEPVRKKLESAIDTFASEPFAEELMAAWRMVS
jgi:hypothetical protein